MKKYLRFHKGYFLLTVILFVTEVLIAVFLNDRFIRPYVGDVLVVILIYCFIRSFFNVPVLPVAIATLIFAYIIEVLQYVRFVTRLGLQENTVARTVMGTSFEWFDMLAYTVGIAVVLVAERRRNQW